MEEKPIGRNFVSDPIDETDKPVCSTDQSANATDPNATLFETQVESPSDSARVAAPSQQTKRDTQPVAAADTRRVTDSTPAGGVAEVTQLQETPSRGTTTPSAAMAATTRDIGEIPRVLGDYELLEEL